MGAGVLLLSILGSYLGTTFALNSFKPQTQQVPQGFGGQQQWGFQQPQQQQGNFQQPQQQGGMMQQQQQQQPQGNSTQQRY